MVLAWSGWTLDDDDDDILPHYGAVMFEDADCRGAQK